MVNMDFYEAVVRVVRYIPAGEVLTYAQVANYAGYERAYRAVGNVLKHNFDDSIPCHRVVPGSYKLGAYNRGKWAKLIKLSQEGYKNNLIPRYYTSVDIDPSSAVNYESKLVLKGGIDYESKSQLKVGIRLSNRKDVGKTQLFTINVSNVNEPATKVKLTNTNTFTTTVPANTLLGTISVIDPEVSQTHIVTLISGQGNNNLFTIVSGQLKSTAVLPKGTYNVVFRVTDNGIPAKTVDLTMVYRVGLYPVYRFYNFKTGAHFYTTNEAEKDKVINTLSYTFVYENIAYYVDALNDGNCNNGLSKVYRFYNFKTGAHFYTTNEAEKDKVINTLSYTFVYEGPRYCLSLSQTPIFSRPIYRFYRADKGFHFYTANVAERDKVINTLSQYFTYEGLRFYGAYDN